MVISVFMCTRALVSICLAGVISGRRVHNTSRKSDGVSQEGHWKSNSISYSAHVASSPIDARHLFGKRALAMLLLGADSWVSGWNVVDNGCIFIRRLAISDRLPSRVALKSLNDASKHSLNEDEYEQHERSEDYDKITGSSSEAATLLAFAAAGQLPMSAYWNHKYTENPDQFDWLTYTEETYMQLQHLIEQLTDGSHECKILHVGCGNSKLPETLYDSGYLSIANIDSSDVVISQMQKRNEQRAGMTWSIMDATHLDYDSDSFDLVIDKGLMDSFACMSGSKGIIRRYLAEVVRVLRPGGKFLCVSKEEQRMRQEYFVASNLSYTMVEPEYTYVVEKR